MCEYRLPRTVVPAHYDLEIHLESLQEPFAFKGVVSITCDVEENVDKVLMNIKDLEVTSVNVNEDGAKNFRVSESEERLEIEPRSDLKAGEKVVIKVAFNGRLSSSLGGFYRVKQSENVFGGACHFEPTGARKAFPCWDEPAFRATFSISIRASKSLCILSNMPEIGRAEEAETVRVSFDKTPSMPTYLVCWSVGEYDFITGQHGNVPIRVFTPLGRGEEGEFALEVAKGALAFYTEFFGVEYKLPKMDLIALADFAIGAMENWGLLTFRERYLLYDPEKSSLFNKQQVALIVAHEVAHQWFGNLVTLDWWTDLWLKEGFATWIEYKCVEHLFPQWNIWTQFLTETYNPGQLCSVI